MSLPQKVVVVVEIVVAPKLVLAEEVAEIGVTLMPLEKGKEEYEEEVEVDDNNYMNMDDGTFGIDDMAMVVDMDNIAYYHRDYIHIHHDYNYNFFQELLHPTLHT
ncbi:hypothetical protein TSUD_256520 [Trifolium subterraneum]|uniref:Uncharacterized protein n=1 Tax=Trifolium subterraneum TaxID=3900 RepID=A0A2Z6M7A7_TRISU|nr:hypothetical protein TSUD_256520 [Trifolium subterraneum]